MDRSANDDVDDAARERVQQSLRPKMHWVCGTWVVVFALLMTGRVTPRILDARGLHGSSGELVETWTTSPGRVTGRCSRTIPSGDQRFPGSVVRGSRTPSVVDGIYRTTIAHDTTCRWLAAERNPMTTSDPHKATHSRHTPIHPLATLSPSLPGAQLRIIERLTPRRGTADRGQRPDRLP